MNARFQELFNKGWVNLNSEERDEYKKLKEEEGEKPADDYTMLKKQMEEMANAIATLKDEKATLVAERKKFNKELGYGEWQEADALRPRKHTAWLKLYNKNPDEDKGLVIFWKVHEYIRNQQTGVILNTIFKIKCWYGKDDVREYLLPIAEYAAITDREQVDVVNTDKKKLVKRHGKVRRGVKIGGYTYSQGLSSLDVEKKDGGDWVDLEEVMDKIVVTIRRADGDEMIIDAKYLNN